MSGNNRSPRVCPICREDIPKKSPRWHLCCSVPCWRVYKIEEKEKEDD